MAVSKAKSADVKQFGQHMVDDRTLNSRELAARAQQKGVVPPATPDTKHTLALAALQKELGARTPHTASGRKDLHILGLLPAPTIAAPDFASITSCWAAPSPGALSTPASTGTCACRRRRATTLQHGSNSAAALRT
jgi:Domain of unknown function (DUF4142)